MDISQGIIYLINGNTTHAVDIDQGPHGITCTREFERTDGGVAHGTEFYPWTSIVKIRAKPMGRSAE